jgi:hypothetical protein
MTRIVMIVVLLCGGWTLWAILYPLTASAVVAAWFATGVGLRHVLPSADPSLVLCLAVVVALIPFVLLIRLEQRMGRFTLYRIPRHVLRLVLLGAWCLQEDTGIPLASLRKTLVVHWFADPAHLAAMACGLLVAHFALWKGEWLREQWHSGLQSLGLRAA